jgi:ribosome-binding factor A
VSDTVARHLSDPPITGFASVTRVNMTPDLRQADVYLSIFAASDSAKRTTFEAITHARARIQSYVAHALASKFCPVLRLRLDEEFQKTLDTMRLIERVAREHPDEGTGPNENDE